MCQGKASFRLMFRVGREELIEGVLYIAARPVVASYRCGLFRIAVAPHRNGNYDEENCRCRANSNEKPSFFCGNASGIHGRYGKPHGGIFGKKPPERSLPTASERVEKPVRDRSRLVPHPREKTVERDAKRVCVGGGRSLFAAPCLRREIHHRAHHGA